MPSEYRHNDHWCFLRQSEDFSFTYSPPTVVDCVDLAVRAQDRRINVRLLKPLNPTSYPIIQIFLQSSFVANFGRIISTILPACSAHHHLCEGHVDADTKSISGVLVISSFKSSPVDIKIDNCDAVNWFLIMPMRRQSCIYQRHYRLRIHPSFPQEI